jgi:ribosomal protein L11 methyltransferase
LVAELAELGFDSFEENSGGFSAYIEEEKMDFSGIKILLEKYAALTPLSYALQKIAKENWNQTWESNYKAIVVDDQVLIKTPFHAIEEEYPIVLTIIPKMSFGTGHHATTSQMISMLLKHSVKNKMVIDAGTGTGILAIMAEKMGASSVFGFDNDQWCIENSKENFELNHCSKCIVELHDSLIKCNKKNADVILANINKNVILAELPAYYSALNPESDLFLSGFYLEDVVDIDNMAVSLGFQMNDQTEKDGWACLLYKKSK